MVLGFPEYAAQAMRLSETLRLPYSEVALHRFPDGESRVTLPASLPEHLVFCRSLNQPNDKLIEFLLCAQTARDMGATRLTLVAPYLCYMRQDKAFHSGEAVSQKIVGRWLADLFDAVITVDPHLHRTHSLAEAVPAASAIALSASKMIGDFLAREVPGAFIIGPDEESLQWVRAVAAPGAFDYAVCKKIRTGDRVVRVSLPTVDLRGCSVVLVDDVVSTGQTIASAVRLCLESGAAQIDVFVTHALFSEGAMERIRDAGVSQVWSTDSIPHESNALHLAQRLAEFIRP